MKYKAIFPVTRDMSPIDYVVNNKYTETKEEEALWHYNHSRAHDGLRPLDELPSGVKFEPIEESWLIEYHNLNSIYEDYLH